MRSSRLLSIQMILETQGQMSARALADALEISVRTLYRDVDQLAAAGVPIFAERGRTGGFRLLPGWKTTLTGLTSAEAQAVFMTGLSGPAAELGLGEHVENARLKLLTSLPANWRDDAQRVSSRFHLDPVDWYRQSDAAPYLSIVAAAVWSEHEVLVRYESWRGSVKRVMSPLGLVLKAGIWYLIGAIKSDPRVYRISNIQAATVLPTPAMRPKGFDLAAFWADSIRRFEKDLYTGRATLLANAEGLRGLRLLSHAVAKAIGVAPVFKRKDGRVKVNIPIENLENATWQLLGLSADVEVVEPPELRQMLIDKIAATARLYSYSFSPSRPSRS